MSRRRCTKCGMEEPTHIYSSGCQRGGYHDMQEVNEEPKKRDRDEDEEQPRKRK